jgi:hypothetical protein
MSDMNGMAKDMNRMANGMSYSPKYKMYDVIMYRGKKYMVHEVDRQNDRYGIVEFYPMYVDGYSVDESATKLGGKSRQSKRKTKRRR